MRVPRIYVESTLGAGLRAELDAAAAEKLARVLRLGRGDRVVLFNGDGSDYLGVLEPLGKGRLAVDIETVRSAAPESPLAVTLLQSLARGEKMDWVLQKATELGVAAIIPLLTERTEVRLDTERTARRVRHWQGVVRAACEQCARAVIPRLAEPVHLSHLDLATLPPCRLVLHPGGMPLRALERAMLERGIAIAVGPEGGFSDLDLRVLERSGFRMLTLGPRVLRTETAGAAALAALQVLHGDMG
jgi:16S rRNA (uracil1498-N3)-methyltransferase